MRTNFKSLNKTRGLIGIILLAALLLWLFKTYEEVIDYKSFVNNDLTFSLALKLMYNSGALINPTILLLAILGFFTPKPIGWILINNMFASFFVAVCLIIMPTSNAAWIDYSIGLVPVGIIVLMHGSKTLYFYGIKRTDLLTFNLIVVVSGLALGILWGYIVLKH